MFLFFEGPNLSWTSPGTRSLSFAFEQARFPAPDLITIPLISTSQTLFDPRFTARSLDPTTPCRRSGPMTVWHRGSGRWRWVHWSCWPVRLNRGAEQRLAHFSFAIAWLLKGETDSSN